MDIKKLKYQKKSESFPPNTVRYCSVCKKKTKWVFNPIISHSQCKECGYRKIDDTLVNYEGKIMKKENELRDSTSDKDYRIYQYLLKLKNKKVSCTLINSDVIDGILTYVHQYEIVMTVEGEKIVIFKHGIIMVKECKE